MRIFNRFKMTIIHSSISWSVYLFYFYMPFNPDVAFEEGIMYIKMIIGSDKYISDFDYTKRRIEK